MLKLVLVSVIIPAFKAEQTLEAALASVKQQGLPPSMIEVVIAADDGHDYGDFRRCWPSVRLAPRHAFRSGPGAARNRGLAMARGHYIAFLDADDVWAPDYVASLLPLARARGVAFAPSHVCRSDGTLLATLAPLGNWLTLEDFGLWPGSFHPFMRAGISHGFDHGPAQDVFHAMRLVEQAGGHAPLAAGTFYRINMRDDSVTADPAFGRRVDRRYQQMTRYLSHPAGKRALDARRRWNRKWLDASGHRDGFYGYFIQN